MTNVCPVSAPDKCPVSTSDISIGIHHSASAFIPSAQFWRNPTWDGLAHPNFLTVSPRVYGLCRPSMRICKPWVCLQSRTLSFTPMNVDKAEAICRNLETFFHECGWDCHCCQQPLLDRCFWCQKPVGWHLCCRNHTNFTNYRWKPGTLYDRAGADVDVSIYQMLDRAESPQVILEVLQHLKDHDYINDNKFTALVREVQAITSKVVDQGSLTLQPGQLPITNAWDAPQKLMSKEKLKQKLQELEHRFLMLWDEQECCYKKWYDFQPSRKIPSQHLAFQQLKFRYQKHEPLLVALVAPAGFGKSELMSSWLHWVRLQG